MAEDAVERLVARVRESLSASGVSTSSFILTAFSGGPDSTALSLALSRLKPEFGFSLELAYIDHGIRPDSELKEEIESVKAFSREIGCTLTISALGRDAVRECAIREKCGIEAAARQLRYRALASIIADRRNVYLALGHTLSDQTETMISRFLTGSGIRGLRGIPEAGKRPAGEAERIGERSFRIFRPLLELEKADIISYLEAMGRSWSIDSSNSSSDYLRNRVRRELLPVVSDLFPGYVKSLKAMRGKLLRIESFLDEASEGLFRKEGQTWRADEDAFFESHPAVRQHALERAMADLSPGRRVPYGYIEKCALVRSNVKGLRRFSVQGCGFELRNEKGQVTLDIRLAHTTKKGYFFIAPRLGRYGPFEGMDFELFDSGDPDAGPAMASFRFPVVVRSARAMDRLAIKRGTKPVMDLLAEWGVREEERSRMPVLEDEAGLICVLGRPLGYRNRFAERGLRINPGDERYLGLKVTGEGGMNGR